MRIRQADTLFKLPGSESPLKKSTSITAIIHGNDIVPNNRYYVDSLQRFKRDFASVDHQQRDEKANKVKASLSLRRLHNIEREQSVKQMEEQNFQRLKDRQAHSLYQHKMGSKLSIHSHGIPIDPVNLFYQNTEKGKTQAKLDDQKKLNGLVRSHHLQTMGTSGYNIINGQSNMTVEQMVPQNSYPVFQQKLNHYYQKFRIKPTDS